MAIASSNVGVSDYARFCRNLFVLPEIGRHAFFAVQIGSQFAGILFLHIINHIQSLYITVKNTRRP